MKEKKSLYHKFIFVLCWLKIIPVSKMKDSNIFTFKIFSLPMLASTLWCLFSFTYYLIIVIHWESQSNTSSSSISAVNTSNMTGNIPQNYPFLWVYIHRAFQAAIFLFILLSPVMLGHFFGLNGAAMMEARFCWPKRGWLLVLSLVIYIVTESTTIVLLLLQLMKTQITTLTIINLFLGIQLSNLTAGIFQFVMLVLVSVRQTNFINTVSLYAADKCKITSVSIIHNILEECDKIRKGVGPLNVFEFSIHVPIILCFSYLGIVDTNMRTIVGNVIWSFLILVDICLMSDDCYDALQSLLPSIR
jgi:hypothetical protein